MLSYALLEGLIPGTWQQIWSRPRPATCKFSETTPNSAKPYDLVSASMRGWSDQGGTYKDASEGKTAATLFPIFVQPYTTRLKDPISRHAAYLDCILLFHETRIVAQKGIHTVVIFANYIRVQQPGYQRGTTAKQTTIKSLPLADNIIAAQALTETSINQRQDVLPCSAQHSHRRKG